jgi:hypothetical protein
MYDGSGNTAAGTGFVLIIVSLILCLSLVLNRKIRN